MQYGPEDMAVCLDRNSAEQTILLRMWERFLLFPLSI